MECIWAYSFLSPLEHIYKSQRYFGTHVVIGTLKSRYVRSTARPHTKVLRDCDLRKGAGNRCRTPCLDVSGGMYMHPYNTYIQSKTVERIGTYSREDPRFLGGSPAHHEWLLLLVPNIYRGCAEFAHRRRSLNKKIVCTPYVWIHLLGYGDIARQGLFASTPECLQTCRNTCRGSVLGLELLRLCQSHSWRNFSSPWGPDRPWKWCSLSLEYNGTPCMRPRKVASRLGAPHQTGRGLSAPHQ